MPWFVNEIYACFTFVACAILFHWFLIFRFPRSSVFWKKVDYFWLSFALLGAIAAIGGNRDLVGRAQVREQTFRLALLRNQLQQISLDGSSEAVCRELGDGAPFLNSEEMRRRQTQYDSQCRWFKRAAVYISDLPKDQFHAIELESIAGTLSDGGAMAYSEMFKDQLGRYNDQVRVAQKVAEEVNPGFFRESLLFLGPFLLAVALALRVTKVTADLLAEKKAESDNGSASAGRASLPDHDQQRQAGQDQSLEY